VGIALLALAIAAGGILALRSVSPSGDDLTYTQLTNFTDSGVAPALSPDGRMLAFIRGDGPFLTASQIYIKMLPNGEAIQLTHDPRPKYGLAFSADGSRIAYTAVHERTWNTYTISPLGGEPRLLLANAAGLVWLDERQFLFSEIKKGVHMGIVTATANRAAYREVYFPKHERAMAHYSYASPDRRWALVVEMDERPVWQPCRLVPLDGSSSGRQVGPRGACTSAGWSPDGKWMYFSVTIGEQSHLWRQRFPNGEPDQMTFGPMQEDGISIAPDGSLVTSMGTHQSTVWIHAKKQRTPGITLQASWYYHSMRTISLKLPDDIDARLEARARDLGMTKSEITREALLRYLDGEPTPGVSCLDLVRDLVGTARGPGDLASNKKYLRGYGR
jgi:dipeptidyl aminopeptidase/acylaminoacyl peptidase